MPVFARSFDTNRLLTWDKANKGNAVRFLFEKWSLPGEPSSGCMPLRLGVRNGYVNFYAEGQSVAKLWSGQQGPRADVHSAYVEGQMHQMADKSGLPPSQKYCRFQADCLARPETIEAIDVWIRTARTYAGAEKRFVDDLVGANPSSIDLEMGLPAADLDSGIKTAPRMDLVVAQVSDDGPASIGFWEAKCATNSDLRALADYRENEDLTYSRGPRVIHQLRKYQQWMASKGRIAEVQEAYKETAKILLRLYEIFRKNAGVEPKCVPIWRKLAEESELRVVSRPGVVVCNYAVNNDNSVNGLGRHAKTFSPHRQKLQSHGIVVCELETKETGLRLPQLSPGTVHSMPSPS